MSPRRSAAEALETRAAVLDAAFRVARGGAGRFTIDAVARDAGVSKGAVLHHFPDKEALAAGMLEKELDRLEEAIERRLASEEPGEPGSWLRAYVGANFELGAGDPNANAALMAAGATNPGLLADVRERVGGFWRRAGADGLDAARVSVVMLATDGLATAEFFGLRAPEGEEREALREALIGLTKGSGR